MLDYGHSPPVSHLFLTVSVVGLLLTANALRPLGGYAQIPSFFASWMVNELPIHTLVGFVGSAAYFVHEGALAEPAGWVALGVTALSCAGVSYLWRQGVHTERTLREALGPHAGEVPWPRSPVRHLLFPFAPFRPGVRRLRDVEFARHGSKRLLLDVYLPPAGERGPARRPAILQIHGGAWVIGDKREQGLPLLYHLAENGWVGFNANYRLSPRATFPDHLIDVKRAIAWIREHADEYGVDPDFVCVTGGSAGGHLTALAALTANDPAYQPGFEAADTSVQGAVPLYGVYCLRDRLRIQPREFVSLLIERVVMKARFAHAPERFHAASPLDLVHAGAPPTFVVHGARDTLAPPEYARLFAEELRKVSTSPVVHAELAGAQHAFDVFTSPRTLRVIEAVERFLSTLHARRSERRDIAAE